MLRAMRLRALVTALALLAGSCGGPAPTPTGPGVSTPAGSNPAATDGPLASPGVTGPTGAVGPLPDPSLTDPAEIGEALVDPARVGDAVVSVLDLLGIGVYTADGAPVRPGSERGPTDLWLIEEEVWGLIEMGREDAEALVAGGEARTLGDLVAPLGDLLPDLSPSDILDAYEAAYLENPGSVMAGVMAGVVWDPATAATRTQLWLMLVDGFILSPTTASLDPRVASLSWLPPRGPLVAAAGADLPRIPSPDPRLDAAEFALLLAHLPVIGFAIPFEVSPSTSVAHEGHGGPGQAVLFEARHLPYASPLVSPFGGQPLLLPAANGLDGLPVTWTSPGESTLRAHGSIEGLLGVPARTDAMGVARLSYEPQEEAANGEGEIRADAAELVASVALVDLVSSHFLLLPVYTAFLMGERRAPGLLSIEWHDMEPTPGPGLPGTYRVTLTGPRAGAGEYSGSGLFYCAAPTVDGVRRWTVSGRPSSGGLRLIDMQENSDGHETIGVLTPEAFDSPVDWFANTTFPGVSVQITGHPETSPPSIVGDAAWSDAAGSYSIRAEVNCSETFY